MSYYSLDDILIYNFYKQVKQQTCYKTLQVFTREMYWLDTRVWNY